MANEIFSTNNTWPNYAAANKATTSTASKELGKDQFLKILITQLQNQDPMQPMEDKEFIAQMAQFSSVEQLVNISTQLKTLNQSLGAVSGMIGMEISWLSSNTADNGTLRQGIVDSIIVRDGVQYAKVGNDEIKLDEIIQVNRANQAEESKEPVENVQSSAVNSNASESLDVDAEKSESEDQEQKPMSDRITVGQLYTGPVTPNMLRKPQSGDTSGTPTKPFAQVLEDNLLKLSNHAAKRLEQRGIELKTEQMKQIGSALDKAAAKGPKESLILMQDMAFIVNVKNRTVVTAMDSASMKDNVFTQIDSAVIIS